MTVEVMAKEEGQLLKQSTCVTLAVFGSCVVKRNVSVVLRPRATVTINLTASGLRPLLPGGAEGEGWTPIQAELVHKGHTAQGSRRGKMLFVL